VFITTKLPLHAVHPDRVEPFMKKSLKNLGLDYVDLYLIHFPIGFKYDEGTEKLKINEKGEIETEGKTDHAAIWKVRGILLIFNDIELCVLYDHLKIVNNILTMFTLSVDYILRFLVENGRASRRWSRKDNRFV
jgi:diketogulonate reductase-like aldo/keto reductase